MNIKKYNEIADKNKPQKQVLKHTASAFLVGGVIGMIGEFFLNLYKELFSFSEKGDSKHGKYYRNHRLFSKRTGYLCQADGSSAFK